MDLLDFAMKYGDSSAVWKRLPARIAGLAVKKKADLYETYMRGREIPEPPAAAAGDEALWHRISEQTKAAEK